MMSRASSSGTTATIARSMPSSRSTSSTIQPCALLPSSSAARIPPTVVSRLSRPGSTRSPRASRPPARTISRTWPASSRRTTPSTRSAARNRSADKPFGSWGGRKMVLEQIGDISLPAHQGPGGFDHAAVHGPRRHLYVAHTANNAVDVIDCAAGKYLRSIASLPAVAGALVSEEHGLVFTSNRGENTVGIFSADHEDTLTKVTVGVRPNGLAYDPGRGLLIAANV